MNVNTREEVKDETELKKKKQNHTRTVVDIAELFFYEYAAAKLSLDISTLQKLCYYSQCHYLAEYNCPLFDEEFCKVSDGPCCEVLTGFVKDQNFYYHPCIKLSE
jgi:uncharacterized phage-associated protein